MSTESSDAMTNLTSDSGASPHGHTGQQKPTEASSSSLRHQPSIENDVSLFVPSPDGGWLALTPEEFRRARSRASEAVLVTCTPCTAGSTERLRDGLRDGPEALLDARGIEGLTAVSASWWSGAARRGDIPHYRIGRWIRFRLSEILSFAPKTGHQKVIGHAHSASATPPRRGRKKVHATGLLQQRNTR